MLVPPADDRAEVPRIIYEELCLVGVRDESRQFYRQGSARLVRAGAAGVVLGCTEIELLVTAADSPVPVFATTRLHVQAAVDASPPGSDAADRSRGPIRLRRRRSCAGGLRLTTGCGYGVCVRLQPSRLSYQLLTVAEEPHQLTVKTVDVHADLCQRMLFV